MLKISLTDLEQKVVSLLLSFIQVYSIAERPTLRIAGGWVRDKLLGKQSNDLDICIDKLKGEPFATRLHSFCSQQSINLETGGVNNNQKTISTVSKIQSNPEKSKHLETATCRIFGLDIDFVNLRSETYLDGSRTPLMEFGTPLQDALRRDLTINSLFYNLNTGLVEDFTGKGLQDLKDGVIRTPMEPLITFTDDPLRVLRVIRFATRFGYRIHEDIYEAVRDESIVTSMDSKLSRERIGIEVYKMLGDRNGHEALRLIHEFGCYSAVFKFKHDNNFTLQDLRVGVETAKILNNLLFNAIFDDLPLNTININHFWLQLFLACALVPFMHIFHGAKRIPACKDVILNGLKLSNYHADFCSGILVNADNIDAVVTNRNAVLGKDRLQIGKLIAEVGKRPVYENWDLAILISLVIQIQMQPDRAKEMIQKYSEFLKLVKDYNLETSYRLKSILDGKQVSEYLKIKPGKRLGEIMVMMLEWQFESGETSRESAYQWLDTLPEKQ